MDEALGWAEGKNQPSTDVKTDVKKRLVRVK
jgi:hypothetical protein